MASADFLGVGDLIDGPLGGYSFDNFSTESAVTWLRTKARELKAQGQPWLEVAQSLPGDAWRRLSAGDGTKGPRPHDWAYVELAHLEAGEYVDGAEGLWTRGLLIRRHIADGQLAHFSTWCPAGTPMEVLVQVEGHRWAIEDAFETGKNELGLDHNETRSWHGWHRHVSLVNARLCRSRGDAPSRQRCCRANSDPHASPGRALVRWSLQEIRRIAARLSQRRIRPALILA
jgi:hypothetical protein